LRQILTVALLGMCLEPPPATAGVGEAIPWFVGEADAAFARARSESKPLFLYWGAVWCPPCNYVKTTLFRDPGFISALNGFVPLWVDGDAESAQSLGERLGVEGYPTMIVFSPSGQELIRLPSDLAPRNAAAVLELSRVARRPARQVVEAVAQGGVGSVGEAELTLLAFHSWDQDPGLGLSDPQRLAVAWSLFEATPVSLAVERSRFLTLWLSEWIDQSSQPSADEPRVELPSPNRLGVVREELTRLLADPDQRQANRSFIARSSREALGLISPEPTSEREALVSAWLAAARALEADESLPIVDRLEALRPQIELSQPLAEGQPAEDDKPSPSLPPDLLRHLRERIAWAGQAVDDRSELQVVMDTMASLLELLGLPGEAEALLASRLDDAAAPYYFVSWLAGLRADGQKPDEALAFYRQAYDRAQGRYTRFRWGSTYLRQQMALAPQQAEGIEVSSREVLGELLTWDDAFAGSNWARLTSLEEAYRRWVEAGGSREVVARLRALVRASCDRYPAEGDDSQRARCLGFLEEKEAR
jgi:protein disulfide-isomerase